MHKTEKGKLEEYEDKNSIGSESRDMEYWKGKQRQRVLEGWNRKRKKQLKIQEKKGSIEMIR